MDECMIKHELETAAQILLAAPDVVTPDQRRQAENAFVTFRKSPMPYAICKHLLDTSRNDYVLYQVATTIHNSLVREWLALEPSNIESIRVYLVHFIVENTSVAAYVREQIVQTLAVIHKRCSFDQRFQTSTTCSDDPLFGDIGRLVHAGTQSTQLIACSILSALLNEYSGGSHTSYVGLTWEQHHKCKQVFEQVNMKQVLLFCVETMSALQKCYGSHIDHQVEAVLGRLLSVIEQIFTWEFTQRHVPRRHIGSFTGSQATTFHPPASWKDIVLDKGLIDMLFATHRCLRDSVELSHQSLLCLSQLASTTGTVFVDGTAHVDYLAYFVRSFLELANSSLRHYEALDVANIINNIVTHCPMAIVDRLPTDLLSAFVSFLANISCEFCRAAALENDQNCDDSVYFEAFDKVLECWNRFITHVDNFPSQFFHRHAVDIFNSYVHCHLAPPDGSRNAAAGESEHEYDEMEEEDKERFSFQLLSIGTLGRLVPEHSLPLLTHLLEERICRLETCLHTIHQQCQALNNNLNSRGLDNLDAINEDLHWLLLITADTLTDSPTNGETTSLPSSIVRSSPSTLTGTFSALLRSAVTASVPVSASEPVTGLMVATFRLCSMERAASDSGLSEHLSPQVGSSLAHLLRRWTCANLISDLSVYENLSRDLGVLASHGKQEDLHWTINFLLDHISLNLLTRGSERELIDETLDLFQDLVNNKQRCNIVVQCEVLWNIARSFSTDQRPFDTLPPTTRRQLCRILVMASAADFGNGRKQAYMQLVLQSIHDRLKSVTTRQDLRAVYHDEVVKSTVLSVIDCLCSVAEASRADNVSLIFNFLYPATVDAVSLLDLYHNYDEVVRPILQFFNIVATELVCYISEKDLHHLYQVVLTMMQTFTKHNIGRRNVSKDTEEEQFASLLTLISLLTNVLAHDYLSLADDDEPENISTSSVTAADVVLYGLSIIVPLMTTELLKFPALFSAYAGLLAYLAEIHAPRLCQLPDDLLHRLMATVELGLTSDAGPDISKACLELVASLASHIFTDETLRGTTVHMICAHFLEVLFHMLLLETFDMDLVETASTAFFSLICIHQVHYQELVNSLLTSHGDSCYHQRLLNAFNALPASIGGSTNIRSARTQFLLNFEQFLVEVRGFLCVR